MGLQCTRGGIDRSSGSVRWHDLGLLQIRGPTKDPKRATPMLHETQRAMAPALHELLSTVSALRNDILAESEELYHSWQSRIERPAFAPGAQNLAAYLALRRRDLRTLQASLMRWGLSSLGRSESRVIASLDAVVASLGSICAATHTDLPDYPDEQRMFAGANTIAQEADAIFGRYSRSREARIMVTL